MKKNDSKKYENINPMTTDIKGLQKMTGLSKNSAMQLGIDAGAVVRLGIRRTLYNVQKVQDYINSKTVNDAGDSSGVNEG